MHINKKVVLLLWNFGVYKIAQLGLIDDDLIEKSQERKTNDNYLFIHPRHFQHPNPLVYSQPNFMLFSFKESC